MLQASFSLRKQDSFQVQKKLDFNKHDINCAKPIQYCKVK